MQDCKDADKKLLELIWVDRDKCVREYNTKKRGDIRKALLASHLFSVMPPLAAVKGLVSIMMSLGWSNKGKTVKLRHYDISRAHFQGTAQRLIHLRLPAEDRQKNGEDKVGTLVRSMYVTHDASHVWQLEHVNLGAWQTKMDSSTWIRCPNLQTQQQTW